MALPLWKLALPLWKLALLLWTLTLLLWELALLLWMLTLLLLLLLPLAWSWNASPRGPRYRDHWIKKQEEDFEPAYREG